MQITHCEVYPIHLNLRKPAYLANQPIIDQVVAIFVRLETRDRLNAWGCGVAHAGLTGETPENSIKAAQECAEIAPDLHPINLEYSLAEISRHTKDLPAAECAFDLAFYDLLGLAAGMPLYRLLGGYRNRIQTSTTIPLCSTVESVEIAAKKARAGFRMLKIKGGVDPQEDVDRIQAIHRHLPNHILRLDADGGYTVRDALAVAEALKTELEMLEQPVEAGDIQGLAQVTKNSAVPILADQSVTGAAAAIELAFDRKVDGLSVKVAACGGLQCARQVDAIARAAHLFTMISCVIEPALLIAAGLSLALSSPSVHYADLDGAFDLLSDPTQPGYQLEDGWLMASDVPGLGCTVNL